MRSFVALPLPADVATALDEALGPLRRAYPQLRWSPPANWHITLAFLGAVTDDVAAIRRTVAAGVEDAGTAVPELRLGAGGRFGRGVLWVGVDDDPPGRLGALADAVQQELFAAQLLEDRRPLQAHVTVARAKGRNGRLPEGIEHELPVLDGRVWTPDAVHVYSSQTRSSGAVYTVEASVPLG